MEFGRRTDWELEAGSGKLGAFYRSVNEISTRISTGTG